MTVNPLLTAGPESAELISLFDEFAIQNDVGGHRTRLIFLAATSAREHDGWMRLLQLIGRAADTICEVEPFNSRIFFRCSRFICHFASPFSAELVVQDARILAPTGLKSAEKWSCAHSHFQSMGLSRPASKPRGGNYLELPRAGEIRAFANIRQPQHSVNRRNRAEFARHWLLCRVCKSVNLAP